MMSAPTFLTRFGVLVHGSVDQTDHDHDECNLDGHGEDTDTRAGLSIEYVGKRKISHSRVLMSPLNLMNECSPKDSTAENAQY